MATIGQRLMHAWNAFKGEELSVTEDYGPSYGYRNYVLPMQPSNGQTIISSIYTRIANDVAALTFLHARLDEENHRYLDTIRSNLNNCMNVEANIDQSYYDFWIDVVTSLLDEGVVAVVPVDTTLNPNVTGSYDILSMRVGRIIDWMPKHVRVRLYNEETGLFQEIVVPKATTAILVNPFYEVMNTSNSTLQRLTRKLALLDYVDEQSGSGKLDLIIQLPYVIKSEPREKQAEKRKKSIETQLAGSKYGIAYIDATERITQLNRPVDNNLLASVESLTKSLYNQLGMTEGVFDGTASEEVMLNYFNNTIAPIATVISAEFNRKFLTKTARTQLQCIMFIRDPFKLVPVNQIAEIADKFTRNEILSSNDVRAILGIRPSSDPAADELRNKNLNQETDGMMPEEPYDEEYEEEYSEGGDAGVPSLEDFINSL